VEGQAVSVRRAIVPFSRVDLSAQQTVTTMLDIPLTHLIQARPRVDILQTLHPPHARPGLTFLTFRSHSVVLSLVVLRQRLEEVLSDRRASGVVASALSRLEAGSAESPPLSSFRARFPAHPRAISAPVLRAEPALV
jgi:hypothetical protein